MKIRRYYGYDCDSNQGFNNGHYIDEDPIECIDFDDATRLCIQALRKRGHHGPYQVDDSDHPSVECITGYFYDGNEIAKNAYDALGDSERENKAGYSYVYISADIEE